MVNNYFKSAKLGSVTSRHWVKSQTIFAFDERDPDDTREAFENAVARAAAHGEKLSVFTQPKIFGPWDQIPVVGVNPCDVHEA